MRKFFLFASAVVSALFCFADNIPDYYVDYVIPNGKLYIDTGIIGKVGCKAEVKFGNVSSGGWPCILGSFLNVSGAQRFHLVGLNSKTPSFQYGGTYAAYNCTLSCEYYTEMTYFQEISTEGVLSSWARDVYGNYAEKTVDLASEQGLIDTGLTMYLFADHWKNSEDEKATDHFLGRIYYAKIWVVDDNGEYYLARDYRPCVKDGVAALYDAASGEICYPNDNTFSAGTPLVSEEAKVTALDYPATQMGRIAYSQRSGMGDASWRYLKWSEYTSMGDGDISNLNGSSTAWQKANLAWSQLRFDGWFYVSAEKAGTWAVRQKFDDYFAFYVDGESVLYNNSYTSEKKGAVEVSEGWHRFRIICGDTFGGYGSSLTVNGVKVPLTITVNDSTYLFSAENFPQGSGSNVITLEEDTDWTELGDGRVSLYNGVVIDLNGYNLTVTDLLAEDYIGTMVTNSSSQTSIIYFTDVPSDSRAYKDGLIKGIDVNVILAVAGAETLLWTGNGEDGDPLNAQNWEDFSGQPAVPNADSSVSIVGDKVNIQIPADSAFVCKAFSIGNCSFTADCDWRGLSVTPIVSGTANLNGFDLRANQLKAADGSCFVNGETEESQIIFEVLDTDWQTLGESVFIENSSLITLDGNIKIMLDKQGSGNITSTDFRVGDISTVEFVHNEGSVALSTDAARIGYDAGGHGIYRFNGGELSSSKDFMVGTFGKGEYIQTGGKALFTSWWNIGRHGGEGVATITGGVLTNSYEDTMFIACQGGKGTLNIGGDATVSVYRMALSSSLDSGASKSYLNISENGLLESSSWISFTESSDGGSYSEGNQSGGTLKAGGSLFVGEKRKAVYNLSAGTVDCADTLYVGKDSGASGYFNQTGGMVFPRADLQVGYEGYGKYTQSGGTNSIGDANLVSVAMGSGTSSGQGVYQMEGGLLSAQGGISIGRLGYGRLEINGGTIETPYILGGSGNSELVLRGGTIKAVQDGALISGISSIGYGNNSTIDTAGYDVSILSSYDPVILATSSLTKTGEGSLTMNAMPSTGTFTVEQGDVVLTENCDISARSGLRHRWSFTDGSLEDSIGGLVATTIPATDPAITFENNEVVMSGNGRGTGSLNLGTGILGASSATVEIWATRTAVKTWSRVFDYGLDENTWWMLTWNHSNYDSRYAFSVKKAGSTSSYGQTNNSISWTNNAPYHITASFTTRDDGCPTIRLTVYDTSTGECIKDETSNITSTNLMLSNLINANFYLGYSQSNDYDANARYDEVRIWNCVMSDEAIALSRSYGPDANAAQIEAITAANSNQDSGVRCQLNICEGATLKLSGATLVHEAVSGNGTVEDGTLVVTDSIRQNLGDCLIVGNGGVLDLSDAKIEIAGLENLTSSYKLVDAIGSGRIVGTPTIEGLPAGWRLMTSSGSVTIGKGGLLLFLK